MLADELNEAVKGGDGVKATIYRKGPLGIDRAEGFVTGVSEHGVDYRPRRGKARSIMSYYDPFWMVVLGWGHPDPGDPWDDAEDGEGGTQVQKALYRGTDPRWVDDFLSGPGRNLKPAAVYRNKKLTVHDRRLPVGGASEDPV